MLKSYRKHGIDKFGLIILERCSAFELAIKEQEWINKYPKDNLFNHVFDIQHRQGESNPNYGKKWPMEKKIKNTLKHPQTKLKESDVLKIKDLLLIGELNDKEIAQKYNVSRTVITRISNGTRWANITGGAIFTSERRGQRNIGKFRSEETKLKIKNAITGIKRSEETKAKISKAKTKKGK